MHHLDVEFVIRARSGNFMAKAVEAGLTLTTELGQIVFESRNGSVQNRFSTEVPSGIIIFVYAHNGPDEAIQGLTGPGLIRIFLDPKIIQTIKTGNPG
ncbi:hypothetical protein TRIP_C20738 [Candidatus Zixiibacteriota bacterium]|nr:hypothetical protein TRIP_C20738 [candidate division Zixibacteria bacterium]